MNETGTRHISYGCLKHSNAMEDRSYMIDGGYISNIICRNCEAEEVNTRMSNLEQENQQLKQQIKELKNGTKIIK